VAIGNVGSPLHHQGTNVSITIHAVVPEALQDLSERLHADDVRELLAYGWESPLDALMYSIDNCRETYMVSWHGEVQGIFGVADYPHDPRFGTPWFLSTGPHGPIRRQFHPREWWKERMKEDTQEAS